MTPRTKRSDEDGPIGYAAAVRSQADNLGDLYSAATGTDCGDEVLTRQEFAQEADINYILNRFGVDQQARPIQYGTTVDYNLDLQQALTALDQVKAINTTIPQELRHKYPTWRELLNATESGAYQHDLAELAARKAAAEEKANKEKGATPENVPKGNV